MGFRALGAWGLRFRVLGGGGGVEGLKFRISGTRVTYNSFGKGLYFFEALSSF